MILEVVILDVQTGQENEFEAAFSKAQNIISSMGGYVSHQLQKCMEEPNRYILMVNWETLEDHMIGFRESEQFQEWRKLLHHFFELALPVQHYETIS